MSCQQYFMIFYCTCYIWTTVPLMLLGKYISITYIIHIYLAFALLNWAIDSPYAIYSFAILVDCKHVRTDFMFHEDISPSPLFIPKTKKRGVGSYFKFYATCDIFWILTYFFPRPICFHLKRISSAPVPETLKRMKDPKEPVCRTKHTHRAIISVWIPL